MPTVMHGEPLTSKIPQPPPPGQPPPSPFPPAPPLSWKETPAPVKNKRRLFRDPLSIVLILVIVVAVVAAGLIGVELYTRRIAGSKVTGAVECVVRDKANVSFGVTPPVLWQHITGHYTNISVHTAGNRIRDAKGMKVDIDIKDVRLQPTNNSKGTIGSLDAVVTWSSDGIKQTVQDMIPIVGNLVSTSVTTNPKDGTIELRGMLDSITAKPQVVDNGLSLQVVKFSGLGLTLPKESVQSTLGDFASTLTKHYPLGIHADSVKVTDSGVVAGFSTRNAAIPQSSQDPCFAGI